MSPYYDRLRKDQMSKSKDIRKVSFISGKDKLDIHGEWDGHISHAFYGGSDMAFCGLDKRGVGVFSPTTVDFTDPYNRESILSGSDSYYYKLKGDYIDAYLDDKNIVRADEHTNDETTIALCRPCDVILKRWIQAEVDSE